jgi:long-chain acyl-CoA synthetase
VTYQLESIATHAATRPDKSAVILAATGDTVSFGELNRRSLNLAKALRHRGLQPSSHLAILMENTLRYYEVAWAAQRSSLFYTPVNWHLTPRETCYIIEDAGAQALVTSSKLLANVADCAAKLDAPALKVLAGESEGNFEGLDDLTNGSEEPEELTAFDETEGSYMFYSSGTTGLPKGIKRGMTQDPFGTPKPSDPVMRTLFGFSDETVYLCPAPLYHAAPLGWSMTTQRFGGTVVLMDHFDPVDMLRAIERYQVTHVQMVPTMFVRLLKLPEDVRNSYDVSSLRVVVHAAAPCPVEVKEKMLEWWGPIIREYYAGSEGTSFFTIGAEEWLEHKGSVGRNTMGGVHVLDEEGTELPPGEIGTIWFDGAPAFEYHNDPSKTAEAFNDRGWNTLGDMGSVDEDGYLYLSDRRTNLIVTGGANVYPQEIEDILALHPEVADVAVIGVHDEDLGQRVLAVVTPADLSTAGLELGQRLIDFCRERLAHYKCPREVVFDNDLPRLPTGKLAKRLLRDRYPA